jgi:hypothetical protein
MTLKDDRLKDASKQRRCRNLCLRCLDKVSNGTFGPDRPGCRFPVDPLAIRSYTEKGVPFNVCAECTTTNQQCIKV